MPPRSTIVVVVAENVFINGVVFMETPFFDEFRFDHDFKGSVSGDAADFPPLLAGPFIEIVRGKVFVGGEDDFGEL